MTHAQDVKQEGGKGLAEAGARQSLTYDASNPLAQASLQAVPGTRDQARRVHAILHWHGVSEQTIERANEYTQPKTPAPLMV